MTRARIKVELILVPFGRRVVFWKEYVVNADVRALQRVREFVRLREKWIGVADGYKRSRECRGYVLRYIDRCECRVRFEVFPAAVCPVSYTPQNNIAPIASFWGIASAT